MLLVVAAVEYATSRPYAKKMDMTTWTSRQDEEVVATPIAPGALITVDGVNHEGIDVHFDKARLDSESKQSLEALELHPPDNELPITWRSTSPDLTGHTTIDVEVTSIRQDPEIHFTLLDERSNAVLSLTAQRLTLRVKLAVVSGGADMLATTDTKSLEWANGVQLPLPGALPVSFDVPEGATIRFVFPSNQPHSLLYLGEHDASLGLAVRDIGVKPLEGTDYTTYACGAEPKHVWLRLSDPRGVFCSSKQQYLFAKELRLIPDSLEILVDGSAWVAHEGRFDRSEKYDRLGKNPVLQKIGEWLIALLVGWIGLKITGIWPGKK
ncbi:hypothetical protein WI23_00830 [Burkholderia oklahomensis C6786]|nr:hypothetical protein WI23_00830 [Burkholderia oklahomensis C6786]KUY61516.1 hypothetical protein WI23_10000 [Burkholderia oklahomensis C6786]